MTHILQEAVLKKDSLFFVLSPTCINKLIGLDKLFALEGWLRPRKKCWKFVMEAVKKSRLIEPEETFTHLSFR